MTTPNNNESLGIKDLIRKVHEELIESQAKRENDRIDPLFTVDKLTIEAQFQVEKKKGKSGGFDLKLVDADFKNEQTESSIHKITLELKVSSSSSNDQKAEKNELLQNIPRDVDNIDTNIGMHPIANVQSYTGKSK